MIVVVTLQRLCISNTQLNAQDKLIDCMFETIKKNVPKRDESCLGTHVDVDTLAMRYRQRDHGAEDRDVVQLPTPLWIGP